MLRSDHLVHADRWERARGPKGAKINGALKVDDSKLGAPKIEGKEAVGGKMHFGMMKMSNNFEVVDAIGKEDGKGMTVTLFAKDGDEYIRVATNVPKPDGGGRATGTVVAGPAVVLAQLYVRYRVFCGPIVVRANE